MRKSEYIGCAVAFVVIAVLPFFVYGDLYRVGEMFGSGDMVSGFTSLLFSSTSVWNGEGIPLWAPWLSNGIPYLADVSLPTLYPPMLLLGFLPTIDYIYAYYGVHLAIGVCFLYLYLRELGCGKKTSCCTALMYLFSVHLGGIRKEHMVIIATVVWLPMLLFFVERYVSTARSLYFFCLVAGMTVQFLGGFVQDEFYTDVFVMIYFIAISRHAGVEWRKILVRSVVMVFAYWGLAAIQLLPTVELLHEYSATAGAQRMTMGVFQGYSIALWKLPMMLFPKFFGDDYFQYGGAAVSSGFDIEIFLGTLLVIFFCMSFRYRSNFYIRFAILTMVGVFLLSAHAHIPGLSKILFHIPVANNMRLVCRMLFVFVLFGYVLFALVFEECRRRDDWDRLLRTAGGVFCISFCIAIFGSFLYGESKEALDVFLQRMGIPLLGLLIFLVILCFFRKRSHSFRYALVLFMVTVINVGQTLPYWMDKLPAPVRDAYSNHMFNVSESMINKESICKILITCGLPVKSPRIFYAVNNTALVSRDMVINSYIAFNNPRLYKHCYKGRNVSLNSTGELTLFSGSSAADMLHYNQDFLSMLGIKYIIDSSAVLENDSGVYLLEMKEAPFFYKEHLQFMAEQPYHVECFPFPKISPNSIYRVSFSCEVKQRPGLFYVDLVDVDAGANVDPAMVKAHVDFSLSEKNTKWVGYISCGAYKNMKRPILRIVSDTKEDLMLKDFTVTRCRKVKSDSSYVYLGTDGGMAIFENPSAKPLFFVPEQVKSISSFEPLYLQPEEYTVDRVAYLEGNDNIDLRTGKADISNISISNNQMSVHVNAQEDTFVNFSQNWYPGWRAYIDDAETKIFMVNGLIQGVFVPQGEHEVVFSYFPDSLKWGIVISFLTLVLLFAYTYRQSVSEEKGECS